MSLLSKILSVPILGSAIGNPLSFLDATKNILVVTNFGVNESTNRFIQATSSDTLENYRISYAIGWFVGVAAELGVLGYSIYELIFDKNPYWLIGYSLTKSVAHVAGHYTGKAIEEVVADEVRED